MILIITLNPCIDKTIYIKKNFFGKIIRAEKVKSIAGFVYGFYQDMPYADCLRIGAAAGAANAAMWDACFCSKDQIFDLVNKVKVKELD